MDHLRELQGRLFSTVFVFILVAAAAYPFFDKISAFLMAPLKPGQELVYLTPGGAFSFIIKVCAYIGLIGTLPILIFHLYRFIMPAVRQTNLRTVLKFTIASLVLAVCGVLFAYYVSLPAALQFLTGFNLNHIDPMLTIDSYFSFIMTYMLAGALLFQLPLIMLIINTVKPLTPKKLMSFQRHMIVISFAIAAIISPTPDALNQTLLASPVVVMYQVGIVLIWRVNRKAKKASAKAAADDVAPVREAAPAPLATVETLREAVQPQPALNSVTPRPHMPSRVRSMDMIRRDAPRQQTLAVPQRVISVTPIRREIVTTPTLAKSVRSIDGVVRIQRTA
jgi:sec-independent protein translocase protein TatC